MLEQTDVRNVFAGRLRSARLLRSLTQTELAKRTGLHPTVISHFEMARRMPSFRNVATLSRALQVSTDYLLSRTDEPGLSSPTTDRLSQLASRLSEDDLDVLVSFAALLVQKAAQRRGDRPC